MLVLTRKVGEEIVIEGEGRTVIRVIQVSANGTQVKIGLKAPKEISINRAELQTRIEQGLDSRNPPLQAAVGH